MDSKKNDLLGRTGSPGKLSQPLAGPFGLLTPNRATSEGQADPPSSPMTLQSLISGVAAQSTPFPPLPTRITTESQILSNQRSQISEISMDEEPVSYLDIEAEQKGKIDIAKEPNNDKITGEDWEQALARVNATKERLSAGMAPSQPKKDDNVEPEPSTSDKASDINASSEKQKLLDKDPSKIKITGVHYEVDKDSHPIEADISKTNAYINDCLKFIGEVHARNWSAYPTQSMRTTEIEFGPADEEMVRRLRGEQLPTMVGAVIKLPLHRILGAPNEVIDEVSKLIDAYLNNTTTYYINFVRLIDGLYPKRLALVYKIAIIADEILQLTIDATIRKFVANLVIFDEYLLLMFKDVTLLRYDTRILMRMILGAYPTTEDAHSVVYASRKYKGRKVAKADLANEVVRRLCQGTYLLSITVSGCKHEDILEPLACQYLEEHWDAEKDAYKLKSIPYELNIMRYMPRMFSVKEVRDINEALRPLLWYNHGRSHSITIKMQSYEPDFNTFALSEELSVTNSFLNEVKRYIHFIVAQDTEYTPATGLQQLSSDSIPVLADRSLEPQLPTGDDPGSDDEAEKDETPSQPPPPQKDTQKEEQKENVELDAFSNDVVHRMANLAILRGAQAKQRAAQYVKMITENTSTSGHVKGEDGVKKEIQLLGEAESDLDVEEDIDEWEAKYGDHSVYPKNVKKAAVSVVENTTVCTIITTMLPVIRAHQDNGDWRVDPNGVFWRLGTRLDLPHEREGMRTHFMVTEFPVIIRKDEPVMPFKIACDPTIVYQKYETVPECARIDTGKLDTKRLLSIMQNILNDVPRNTAEALAYTVTSFTDQRSHQALFTIGFMLTIMLKDLETANIRMRAQNLQPEDIVLIRLDRNGGPADIAAAQAAINNARVVLKSDEINNMDVRCMRLISAGTQGLTTHASSIYRHILSSYHFEQSIEWAIIENAPENTNIPDNVEVASHEMFSFLLKIAEIMRRKQDMVRGFIRASVLTHVRRATVKRKEQANTYFMFNSALEVMCTSIPATRGDNWVWRFAEWLDYLPNESVYAIDARDLCNTQIDELRPLATVIASTISLGYSHVWHTYNMTGTTIAHAYRPDQPSNVAMHLIRGLTTTAIDHRVPLVSTMACNWVSQMTPCAIPADCFTSQQWSGTAISLAVQDVIHNWRHIWPEAIPYFLQPHSIMFTNMVWDEKWGLTAPGVEADFYNEVQVETVGRTMRWSAWYGDNTYAARTTSQTPYVYVPYGAFAINTIQQEGRAQLLRVRYHTAVRTAAAQAPISAPVERDNMRLNVQEQLLNIRVGCLVTYDWRLGQIIAPTVLLEDQPQELRQVMEIRERRVMIRAGICLPMSRTFTSLSTDVADAITAANAGCDSKGKDDATPHMTDPKPAKAAEAVDDGVPTAGKPFSGHRAPPTSGDVPADSAAALVGGAEGQPKV